MKCRVASAVAVFLLAVMPSAAPGRGGGGCLEKGSSVLTPSGPVAVENLAPGDVVLSFSDRRVLAAKIQAVIVVDAAAYYELTVGGHVLRLTGEHPVATAPGVFRTASSLRPGDRVLIGGQDAVADGVVESVKRLPGKGSAYNLLVSPGGTYLANGIVVHNKGCFLPETLIRKEDGSEVPISSVRPTDRLLAFTISGRGSDRQGQERGDLRGGAIQGRDDAEHRGSRHGGAPLLCRQRHIQDLGGAEGRRSHLRL